MNKHWRLAFIALSLCLVSFTSWFYSIDDVVVAMRSGNANQLSRYFDSRIDISLPGKSDNYSKSQGEMILKDFFSTNKVKNFQIKHRGENKDGSLFCVGTLNTSNGNFRTKFFMKQKGEQQVVQEIGFELVE